MNDGDGQLVQHARSEIRGDVGERSDSGRTGGISVELAEAFVASPVGMCLAEAFPIGTLTRGKMHILAAWQAKFHPEIRKRKSKHRKKK